jgi:hypothetical protein
MTQTSNLLNAEYLHQTSILTSEISVQDVCNLADDTRISTKSANIEKAPIGLQKNPINI